MMELDEAISHAEEIAELNEEDSKAWTRDGWQSAFKKLTPEKEAELKANRVILAGECAKCAEEHRQLAEWLKELKALRENKRPYGKWIISEVRCPYCLEYFDTDVYNEGELDKCPCCGKDMERGQ